MIHTYPLLILEAHLDTFGHVNNATYLALFEQARWDLISNRGFTLEKIQQEKKGPIIMEVNLRFMKELKLREQVRIDSELISYKGKVGTMSQKIVRVFDEKICAELTLTFGLFDMVQRKLISPTDEWLKAISTDL